MKELILVKVGELALKGLNKHTFEDILVRNLRRALKPLGECKIQSAQSTIYIFPQEDSFDMDLCADRVGKGLGFSRFSRC